METMEKNVEHGQECEHNGCVGHPITNMLMAGEGIGGAAPAEQGAEVIDLAAARAEHAEAHAGTVDEEMEAEVLANIEAAFEEMIGKVETAVRQVRDTDERTAHLVITCERLVRGQVDLYEKMDRIINHFKVA